MFLENSFVKNANFISSEGAMHYGLNHLLRQWICLSFTRRSFRLTELASRLANKVGISMDQIICGKGMPEEWKQQLGDVRLDVLSHSIANPVEEQNVGGTPLPQSEIPFIFFKTMRCFGCTDPSSDTTIDLGSRWILVREYKYGQARFFVSEAFSREIVDLSTILKTWKENKMEVNELFMSMHKTPAAFGRTLIYQVAEYHSPAKVLAPCKVSGINICSKNGKEVVTDAVLCYGILTLDHSIAWMEFIPRKAEGVPDKAPSKNPASIEEDILFSDLLDDSISDEVGNWLSELLASSDGSDGSDV